MACLLEALAKCTQKVRAGVRRSLVKEPDYRHRLLRAHHERPRCCAAEQRDEPAPPHHSITSSAMASSPGDTASPSTFTVFMLITNTYFIGCITGRSAGLAPFRIRPA